MQIELQQMRTQIQQMVWVHMRYVDIKYNKDTKPTRYL